MASIIIISGKQKGDFYRLGHRTTVIGRDETLPIQIIDNHISRKHLRIRFNQNSWSYSAIDIGSKNGVLINGVKIEKKIALTNGDHITIGDTSFIFTLKDFFDRRSAQDHAKRLGQQENPTQEY